VYAPVVRLWPLLALALWAPAAAQAQGDGSYGRLEADLMLSIGAGGGIVLDAEQGAVLGDVRLRWLDMVGFVIAPEWRPDVEGRLALAVEVRPLFPARFFLNSESGIEWLDLLVDSIGAEVGASIAPLVDGSGAALMLGFGLDVPILVPSIFADGLLLHLGARHVFARPQDLGAPPGGASEWLFYAVLTVKIGIATGIVAIEPSRWRADPSLGASRRSLL
jgi:hypothetical protein